MSQKYYFYRHFGISTITLSKEEKRGMHPARGVGAQAMLLDSLLWQETQGGRRVKGEVLPCPRYLYHCDINLTLRFDKFIAHSCLHQLFTREHLFRDESLVILFLQASSLLWVGLGFFCPLIDGKCLQNAIQIKKSKNTAFVCMESLLQMSCLHILKLKINIPLPIKKEYFTASVVKRLWISSLAVYL